MNDQPKSKTHILQLNAVGGSQNKAAIMGLFLEISDRLTDVGFKFTPTPQGDAFQFDFTQVSDRLALLSWYADDESFDGEKNKLPGLKGHFSLDGKILSKKFGTLKTQEEEAPPNPDLDKSPPPLIDFDKNRGPVPLKYQNSWSTKTIRQYGRNGFELMCGVVSRQDGLAKDAFKIMEGPNAASARFRDISVDSALALGEIIARIRRKNQVRDPYMDYRNQLSNNPVFHTTHMDNLADVIVDMRKLQPEEVSVKAVAKRLFLPHEIYHLTPPNQKFSKITCSMWLELCWVLADIVYGETDSEGKSHGQ